MMEDHQSGEAEARSEEKMLQALARMIDLDPDAPALWNRDELKELLEHQLAAPLEFDLIGVDRAELDGLLAKREAGPKIETFGDLMRHPRPPVGLLNWTKEFAKAARDHPDSPLPDEVASVLYLASIVAAMTRCGERLTRLGDDGLLHGLAWALKQTWLDESVRKLLKEGRTRLAS
jgi:hypothetical protein